MAQLIHAFLGYAASPCVAGVMVISGCQEGAGLTQVPAPLAEKLSQAKPASECVLWPGRGWGPLGPRGQQGPGHQEGT